MIYAVSLLSLRHTKSKQFDIKSKFRGFVLFLNFDRQTLPEHDVDRVLLFEIFVLKYIFDIVSVRCFNEMPLRKMVFDGDTFGKCEVMMLLCTTWSDDS